MEVVDPATLVDRWGLDAGWIRAANAPEWLPGARAKVGGGADNRLVDHQPAAGQGLRTPRRDRRDAALSRHEPHPAASPHAKGKIIAHQPLNTGPTTYDRYVAAGSQCVLGET